MMKGLVGFANCLNKPKEAEVCEEDGEKGVSEAQSKPLTDVDTNLSVAGDPAHLTRPPSLKQRLCKIVLRLLTDVMLLFVVLSTVLGVVTNTDREKLRAPHKPKPFFSDRAPVSDYYAGNVFDAFHDASQYENSLFMYYAPWDRESQEARAVLAEVAKFFHNTDLLVAAVNCWYPSSACAKEFGSKSGSSTAFPVLIFYPGGGKGVQYRGPLRPDHLVAWLRACRYPMSHLRGEGHLRELRQRHHTLLLAFLPLTGTNRLDGNHRQLLQGAYQLLEIHPDHSIGVAVTADHSLARSLKLGPTQPLRLLTWKSSVSFPNKTVSSHESLVHWVVRQDSRPVSWLSLPGRKSLMLQQHLQPQAVLLFTPRLALKQPDSLFLRARQLIVSYLSCTHSPQESLFYQSEPEQCLDQVSRPKTAVPYTCQVKSWSQDTNGGPPCKPTPVSGNLTEKGPENFEKQVEHHDPEVQLLMEEYSSEADIISSRIQEFEGGVEAPRSRIDGGLQGLGCESNITLKFYFVDSSVGGYRTLRDSFGITDSKNPTIVLVNPAEEILHIRESEDLLTDLEAVVVSWHKGELGTYLGRRSSDRGGSLVRLGQEANDCPSPEVSCVQEVTRDTWQHVEGTQSDATLMLYTSTFCSHCHAANHAFHRVSLLLGPLLPSLTFRLVDGPRNDLGWSETTLQYPAVTLTPKGRPDLTRLFPDSQNINTTNLISFVLANLGSVERLQVALNTCSTVCLARVRATAATTLSRLFRLSKRLQDGEGSRARAVGVQKRLKYVKTVLYVVTAWAQTGMLKVPKMSENFYLAILNSFLEVQRLSKS